ncbi:protein kinase C and casein kinase substrate in neurons protein 2 isoform X2 [Achroia grisella]|uniref:protein kinase C and casein kinase substrate in neurons protein 2 isoform X2 n=1 Tax=Achroia grisella TaxID=688607 RepID=UPI0027D2CB75|nr:protein kinase C and casein kinase substrate in neurons protein 2 isoform X2 [Achroia grisella]
MTQIKNWQKDTYHKSMIQLKERKEMDEAFKKAQKPWAKLLQKVERTRLEYHTACKQERTAQNQERNASGDSSLSQDQRAASMKKMGERVVRCREEVSKNREKYQAALAEITAYNPRYIEDMSGVFERCQQMEALRLTFFKDVLFSFHKSLNISQEPSLPQIYEEFHHTINNADHQKDLKWWANNHGINMVMAWPQFEEYTEEFRDIAKGKSKESLPTGPITLLNQRPVSEDELPPINANNKSSGKAPNHTEPPVTNNTVVNNTNSTTANNTIDKKNISAPIAVTNGTASAPKSNKTSPAKESAKGGENPFEEDEWDEESGGALTDTGEPGVPVRALYDYTGAESDELSFRQGDLFEKLEDEDEQGWCKGRKDGRVGLYPANYVEPVGH